MIELYKNLYRLVLSFTYDVNLLGSFRTDPVLNGLFRQTPCDWRIEVRASGIIGTENTSSQETFFTFPVQCSLNASQKKEETAPLILPHTLIHT